MKIQLKKAHSKLMQWGTLAGTALSMFYINASFASSNLSVSGSAPVSLQTMAQNTTSGIEGLATPVIAIIVIFAIWLFLSGTHGLVKTALQGHQAQVSVGVHIMKICASAVMMFSLYFGSSLMYTATGTNVNSSSDISILKNSNTGGSL